MATQSHLCRACCELELGRACICLWVDLSSLPQCGGDSPHSSVLCSGGRELSHRAVLHPPLLLESLSLPLPQSHLRGGGQVKGLEPR